MIIKTKRLSLREMTEADFDALYQILADPKVMQFFLIHKCISLPLCLLKPSIREIKMHFKCYF